VVVFTHTLVEIFRFNKSLFFIVACTFFVVRRYTYGRRKKQALSSAVYLTSCVMRLETFDFYLFLDISCLYNNPFLIALFISNEGSLSWW